MVNKWTREETLVAFNVYCKIPFKDSHSTHPMIVEYAKIIGRSPGALNMKIGNLCRLDPKLKERGIVGLSHGAKLEEDVWNEFYANPDKLAYESECQVAKFSKRNIEDTVSVDIENLPQGKERFSVVKQRVNQSFFRSAVMCAYNSKCCISGVGSPELVEACHIVSWSEDSKNRSSLGNRLCMNAFFHKAYDNLLIGITPDFDIVVCKELLDKTDDDPFREYLLSTRNKKLTLPTRFYPKQDFLDHHYQKYLNR